MTKLPHENTISFEDPVRWQKLALRRQEVQVAEVFRCFLSKGIEPILIKGWAAARYYPPGVNRGIGDVDVAVSAANFDAAGALAISEGFPQIPVDVHREFRHYDRTPWAELFGRSIVIEVDGVPIRLLRPEDHLRVLCVHWLNDGGEYKDRLWDIYYAVENRPIDFDWNLCLDGVSATRRKWITTTLSIAHRYLNLDISEIGLSDADLHIPKWIETTLQREWSSEIRLRALETCIRDPALFIRQLRKRIPPNPIQATIEGEAEFDERSRIPVQLKTGIRRILPSIRRVSAAAKGVIFR